MQIGLYLHTLREYVWRVVSEDSQFLGPFLLIVSTYTFSLLYPYKTSNVGYRDVPAYSQILQRPLMAAIINRYSYGRRLPGLQFKASPCG